jgi:hypothetical protein
VKYDEDLKAFQETEPYKTYLKKLETNKKQMDSYLVNHGVKKKSAKKKGTKGGGNY